MSQETHLLADLGPVGETKHCWASLEGPPRVQLTHQLRQVACAGHLHARRPCPRWGRRQHAAGFLAAAAWLLPREMSKEA